APGETTARIEIPVFGDAEPEPDEVFTLVLDEPTGATVGQHPARITVLDDDGYVSPESSMPTWVSDLVPVQMNNGYGPVERDTSNGGSAAGDGLPIRLNGVEYAKGLGVHAVSNVTYALRAS